jgi:predicted metalloendopeptidase
LKELIESPLNFPNPQNDSEDYKRLFETTKALYDSCVDETTIERRGLEPLQHFVHSFQSQYFPLSNQDGKLDPQIFAKALAFSHEIYAPSFFTMFPAPDLVNTRSYNLSFVHDGTTMVKEMWFGKKNITDEYEQVVKNYFKAVEIECTSKDISDIINLEVQLANLSLPITAFQNPVFGYNPVPVSDLKPSQIDFLTYINARLPRYSLNKSSIVIVRSPEYFKELSKILDKTPIKVIENYMTWRIIHRFSGHMTASFKQIVDKLDELLGYKTKTEEPRWKVQFHKLSSIHLNIFYLINYNFFKACLNRATIYGDVLGREYLIHQSKYSNLADEKSAAERIVNSVKSAILTKLKNADWLDEVTRAKAVEKVPIRKTFSLLGI